MELAINGKTYNLRIIRKTNSGISLYFIAQEDNQTDIKRIRITKTQNFTISFKTTEFEKLTKPQAQTNFFHSKSFEHQPLCFASKEKIQRKPQQYFYDTIGRLSS